MTVQRSYWLVVEPYPSEKYDFVSWDDDIPNIMGKIKAMFQTTNQLTIIHSPEKVRLYWDEIPFFSILTIMPVRSQ